MSSFIPESAPFNEEQRAWLNGFFSGLMGIRSDLSPIDALRSAGIDADAIAVAESSEEEEFPWHDSSLPIVDRMDMADGKPLPRKLMAAMAQLDCGSCGYVCQTYAEAIASGEEKNLTLCSPGGKETKQMIKKLLKESGEPTGSKLPATPKTTPETSSWSRNRPFSATLIESRPLNKEGSAKDTRHVTIDLNGSDLQYAVGDALGVYPTNCPELVDLVLQKLQVEPDLQVDTPMGHRRGLAEALIEDCCLRDPSDELIELLSRHTKDPRAKRQFEVMMDDGPPDGCDVLDMLSLAGDAPISATEFVAYLSPLNPRLYSIASSMKAVGNEVHLTVGKVTYDIGGRLRKGVASTMLADRITSGERLRVFVQPNHGGFTVPSDPNAPMIMIGPGTGIAPFVAFLQERQAANASGDNWLFFGDQHRKTDFLYQGFLEQSHGSGLLTRLDTAFSRDGQQKIYVQDRMRENAEELWRWIERGAYFYVCGDANRMANDVHQTLVGIVEQQRQCSSSEAAEFVEQLKRDQHYVRDVY